MNYNWNWYFFIEENTFENVVGKMAAILSRAQCVDIQVSVNLAIIGLGNGFLHALWVFEPALFSFGLPVPLYKVTPI